MTQEHPITPPPELVHEWARYATGYNIPGTVIKLIATQAARWGADQELEACCQALYRRYDIPSCIHPKMAEEMRDWLRAARRLKPPSLKEQAFELVDRIEKAESVWAMSELDIIRRALESLPE